MNNKKINKSLKKNGLFFFLSPCKYTIYNHHRRSQRRKKPGFKIAGECCESARFKFARRVNHRDLYYNLGLHKDCSVAEISSSYRKLALDYHPDHNSGLTREEEEERKKVWNCINETYEILKDEDSRRIYNNLLESGKLGNHGDVDYSFSRLANEIASIIETAKRM